MLILCTYIQMFSSYCFFLLLAVKLKDFLLHVSVVKRLVQVEFTADDQRCGNLSLGSIRNKLMEKCDFFFFKYYFSTVKLIKYFFNSMLR